MGLCNPYNASSVQEGAIKKSGMVVKTYILMNFHFFLTQKDGAVQQKKRELLSMLVNFNLTNSND